MLHSQIEEIPANQSSATFTVSAVDDHLPDASQPVIISASAAGYVGGTFEVIVQDAQALAVHIPVATISERGGSVAGTVHRGNANTAQPLVVQLTSDDETAATVPDEVEILAGETSATFVVSAVDDNAISAPQTAASDMGLPQNTATEKATRPVTTT